MAEYAGIVHDGNYKVTWVPTLTDPTAPTVTELTAVGAIDLEGQITPDGLNREASDEMVDTSRLSSVFTTQRIGRTGFEVSVTLVRLDLDAVGAPATDEAYDTLVKGAEGYLVIRDNAPSEQVYAAADIVEVYQVECGTRSKATPAANEQQTFTVPMSVVASPNLDVVVAAGA